MIWKMKPMFGVIVSDILSAIEAIRKLTLRERKNRLGFYGLVIIILILLFVSKFSNGSPSFTD